MRPLPIKRVSTLFLKGVLLVIGIIVLVSCGFLFPWMWTAGIRDVPQFRYVIDPAFIAFFATIVPFIFALYQAFKLLHYIDKSNAFSEQSVEALRNIKFSAIAMSVLYWACMPFVFAFADLDDAPGAVIIGAAIACAPLVVATFAAVLQKLVQNAIDLKVENDLTV